MTNSQNNTQDILANYYNELPVHVAGVLEGSFNYSIEVTPGAMVPEIAQLCNQLMSFKGMRPLSFNLESYFNSLIHYRVLQVEGKAVRELRDIAIPSFFYPVLAALGRYDDPLRAISFRLSSDIEPMSPEEMMQAAFELRASGIQHSLGFPRQLTVASDEFFRVSEESGELRVAGPQVSNPTLFVRTAVRVEFLKEFFGSARTRYLSVEDSRNTWTNIVDGTFLSNR